MVNLVWLNVVNGTPGLVHLENFILTHKFSIICRDYAKTAQ